MTLTLADQLTVMPKWKGMYTMLMHTVWTTKELSITEQVRLSRLTGDPVQLVQLKGSVLQPQTQAQATIWAITKMATKQVLVNT